MRLSFLLWDEGWLGRKRSTPGDPLSPALFVLFCSPLIGQLQAVSPLLVVRLYVDDLLVYLEAMPRPAMRVMKGVIAALERFGDFSGLRLNFDKTRFLLMGFRPDPVRLSYFCLSGQGVFPYPVGLLVFAVCVSGGT